MWKTHFFYYKSYDQWDFSLETSVSLEGWVSKKTTIQLTFTYTEVSVSTSKFLTSKMTNSHYNIHPLFNPLWGRVSKKYVTTNFTRKQVFTYNLQLQVIHQTTFWVIIRFSNLISTIGFISLFTPYVCRTCILNLYNIKCSVF